MRQIDQYVPMPDDIRLDVTSFVPSGPSPSEGFPAVLVVHGHGDDSSKAGTVDRARMLAEKGYVTLNYSVRGQGASEGLSHTLSIQEGYDLQEIITWSLENLPINPKKLTVTGGSQGGWHAYMAASHDDRVACAIAENAPVDLTQMALPGGCMGRWFYTMTMRRKLLTAGYPDVVRQWTATDQLELVEEWVRVRSPLFRAHRIQCPLLIVHGWYDEPMPVNHTVSMWQRASSPDKKLFLGLGRHGLPPTQEETEHRLRTQDRWLDHQLKGDEDGWPHSKPIQYTMANTLEQRFVEDFPPPGVQWQELYLQAGGTLSPQPPKVVAPPSSKRNRSLDPAYKLRTALLDDFARAMEAIPMDSVSFDTDPMPRDLEIVGMPTFRLHVQSDRSFYQLNLLLHDIAPDGTTTYITRGNVGRRTAAPGRICEEEVSGAGISYLLRQGHRIRLEVTNASFPPMVPYFEEFLCRIFHEGKLRSSLRVPTLPR